MKKTLREQIEETLLKPNTFQVVFPSGMEVPCQVGIPPELVGNILQLFKDWALETLMTSHRDGCALYRRGEQTDSCDCTVEDLVNTFAGRIEEISE